MKKKSLGINAVLNALKSTLSIIFSLITFPYISRVLQVSNLGKYNFASSVVSYFILFAQLGISTYAIREGTQYREKRELMEEFASDMFTINILSTLFSVLLLILSILYVNKFSQYSGLLIIFAFQIVVIPFGVEWLYTIYEDFLYITIRSIVVQILSIIMILLFINNENDYYIYAIITVSCAVITNFINFFHAKKYIHIKFKFNNNDKLQ